MSIGPDVQYPSHRKRIANRENKGDKFKKKSRGKSSYVKEDMNI